MENTLTPQKKKSFFQRLAEFAFMLYMITLYIFVDKKDTLVISQIVFIAFTGLTVLVILQKQRIHFGKNVMIVYLAFTWMFATYFWAQNQYVAWVKIKSIWKLFMLFFLTYNLFSEKENAHEYLLKCLYVSGIVLIGYSIHTYGLSDVIDMMTGNRNVRLGGKINQENVFGMMNATTCMISFYYMFYRKRYELFHIAIFALAFLFAMASGSRKALLIVCIGILFLTYKRYGIRQVYKVVAIVLVLSILFIGVIQLPVFDTINYRMELLVKDFSGQGKIGSSANVRKDMITDGWDMFKVRVITGYGADNFSVVSRYGAYAHNNFIEILVDYGASGFILYYMIYWYALRNLWKMKSDAGKALLCVFLVRIFMEVAMVTYVDKIHWALMAFLLLMSNEPKSNVGGELENEVIFEKNEERYN